ncbi:MAG: hypothetical protein A2018_04535 [Alphaproteobacteria bacterium GWF2_58_20]|nr:MAG: hypothetical protein A2018_04535 [Alphaproteobacteria bacterium GWF2_58_20]
MQGKENFVRKENDNNLPKVRFYPQALLFFAFAGLLPLLVLQGVAVHEGARYGFVCFFLLVVDIFVLLAFAWRRGALSGE